MKGWKCILLRSTFFSFVCLFFTCRELSGRRVVELSSCSVPITVFMYRTWQLMLCTSTEKKFGLLKLSVVWGECDETQEIRCFSVVKGSWSPKSHVTELYPIISTLWWFHPPGPGPEFDTWSKSSPHSQSLSYLSGLSKRSELTFITLGDFFFFNPYRHVH